MSVPVESDPSRVIADDQHPTRDPRWPRLAAGILTIGACGTLGSFINDCFWYLWNHGPTTSGLSAHLLFSWVAKAVGFGLFFGLFLGLAEWLGREVFNRPKPNSSQRPGA